MKNAFRIYWYMKNIFKASIEHRMPRMKIVTMLPVHYITTCTASCHWNFLIYVLEIQGNSVKNCNLTATFHDLHKSLFSLFVHGMR